MSQAFKKGAPGISAVAAAKGAEISPAAEASVRQMIANGKSKVALDNAKELHKAHGTVASEALLVDAYAARIDSLLQQNLALEAKSLLDLVRERYPSAKARLDALRASAAARTGALDELVAPLTDPNITADQRAAIEQALQKTVFDLTALAKCAALPPNHPLRTAAAALDRAFAAVTSGPVSEEETALPEVPRRSPLAPWKLLVRAIASFHRGEDARCREFLDAIEPASAPVKLVPAMRAMVDGKAAAPLSAAATALVSRTTTSASALRRALQTLESVFESDGGDTQIFKAIRAVTQECKQSPADEVARLREYIAVRCAVAGLNQERSMAAIGAPLPHHAAFARLWATGFERSGDEETMMLAAVAWHDFLQAAVEENWFTFESPEAAALFLHMAALLQRVPPALLRDIQKGYRIEKTGASSSGEQYFLYPEKLYQRACAIDPQIEAFSQWLGWARKPDSGGNAEEVAENWHRARPLDMEPVLYLMEEAAKRSAFQLAIQYLEKAEQIDRVNPEVRRARLRLLAGNVLRHIQQKKAHLATGKLTVMAALPQAQQGSRPAFLAALRYLTYTLAQKEQEANAERAEIERLLGSDIAASLLIFTAATAARRNELARLQPAEKLSAANRAALPGAMAKVAALAADMQLPDLKIPAPYFSATAKELPHVSQSLDLFQLRTLAEMALGANQLELAYTAAGFGLTRGGATEAAFLLLRAKSIPPWQQQRCSVCAAAAAELARQRRDMQIVDEAVEILRQSDDDDLDLTPENIATVLQQEKAAAKFPRAYTPGPDYSDFVQGPCGCPDCRAKRGEIPNPFDDDEDDDDLDGLDDMDEIFSSTAPPEIPPEVSRMLYQEATKAINNGESLEALLARLMNGPTPSSKGKRRRR